MPNMNGLELLQKIKDRNPKMPVVLISGYSVEETTDQDGAKPDGFLAKPFMMADVERLLNALL
jgi:two-component SAPR family response regulator